MDCSLALMCGIDIPVQKCQLIVHQPLIEEIAFIGKKDFFSGVQCLCLYKSMFVEDKNLLSEVNNFQIFMTIMQEAKAKDKKEAVKKVLTLLFPDKKILFTPKSLLFQQDDNESIVIDERNFEDLQEVLRQVFCMQNAPMDQQTFNPSGDKAKKIAQKLMRGRERIAAERGDHNSDIFSQYISSLSIGLHISVRELNKYTMFQLYNQVERFMLWTNWDLDNRIRLAGGKPDDKPENWMKNLH